MSRRCCIALTVLWLVATTALVVRALHKARRAEQRSSPTATHGAIERNQRFAERVWSGRDPYATPPLHAPYPPSYGFVLGPLAAMPTKVARVLWVVLQMLMLVAVMRLLAAAWQSARGRAPPAWVWVAALLLVSRYLLRDTHSGGGNLIWAGLVLWTCLAGCGKARTRERAWHGIGLGVVLAAKPTPLLFVPWLWIRGQRRTAAVAVAVALGLHAAPALTLGFDGWLDAYGRWAEGSWAYATQLDVFAQPAFDFPDFSWMNQSLRFALARFLGTVPSEHVIDNALFFDGLGIAPGSITWITRAVSLAVLLWAARALWRVRRLPSADVDLLAMGLLFAATLLLSPITWKSHHVQLLPAFVALLAAVIDGRRRLLVGLVAYFILCNLLSQEIIGKAGKNVMQSASTSSLWVPAGSWPPRSCCSGA